MQHEAAVPLARIFTDDYARAEKARFAVRVGGAAAAGSTATGAAKELGLGPEFVAAAGAGGSDAAGVWGSPAAAQVLLNQKQLSEVEALLEAAQAKADALDGELESETTVNRQLRKALIALKTTKLDLEDRIEDYTREMDNRGAVKGKIYYVCKMM